MDETAVLSDLGVGEIGIVLDIMSTNDLAHRLLALGLRPGVEIAMLMAAPTGDPAAFEISGACIAIRREDCKSIKIAPRSCG